MENGEVSLKNISLETSSFYYSNHKNTFLNIKRTTPKEKKGRKNYSRGGILRFDVFPVGTVTSDESPGLESRYFWDP